MAHTYEKDSYFLTPETWTRVRNSLAFVALASWAALAAGYALEREQFHFSYLTGFMFSTTMTLGALFYVMVQHLTGSAWSVTVRRLMESMMRVIPLGLILFIPVILGISYTFRWAHAGAAAEPAIREKAGYLNPEWFTIRGVLVLIIWSLFAIALFRWSRSQDDTGSLTYTRRASKLSAPGVLVLFLSASLASFDWVMSLDARWYSTMFGVYTLAGGALGFMALLIIVCMALRGAGYLVNAVNEEHYHDLGKWLFTLIVFWAYIAFSQYMLIWYGNLPEETLWFKARLEGSWKALFFVLIFGHFFVPFFGLLPRASKRNLKVLGFFAGWMLVMHYVDIYWQIMPVLHRGGASFHWLDAAAIFAVGSAYGLVFWSAFKRKPLVPVGDPRLDQCLAFHNA